MKNQSLRQNIIKRMSGISFTSCCHCFVLFLPTVYRFIITNHCIYNTRRRERGVNIQSTLDLCHSPAYEGIEPRHIRLRLLFSICFFFNYLLQYPTHFYFFC
ncbi:hypothetical protein F4703DRAFT_1301013 [Phycomyces blakesleeanus]